MAKGKNSGTITIRLPDEQIEQLKKVASENKISVSELIKRFISHYGIQVKRSDVEELKGHLATLVKVQRILEEQLNELSQFDKHILWDKSDSHLVEIDGKKVQCFPLYWIRAIKRS